MTAPVRPSLTRRTHKAFQKKKGTKLNKRLPVRAALLVLFLGLTVAAYALTSLPGSSAATARRAASSAPAPALSDAAHVAPAARSARGAGLPAAVWAAAPAFFQAAPIATFAADCTTPKSSFNLGEVVCVKISGAPTSGAAVVFSDPDNFQRSAALPVTANAQSFSFTLPASATTAGTDNRGTWAAAVVDTTDNSRRAVVTFLVHDPNQAVADVTISKTPLDTGQITAGGNTSFRIYVTNQGPDPATNVSFTDNTLSNTLFVSFTQDSGPTFNCTSPAVNTAGSTTCTAATMAVGAAASFTAVYKISTSIGNNTDLTDTVGVNSDATDSRISSNSSTAETTASNPTPPACTLSCPANVTVTAAAGQSGAAVTFPETVVGAACGAATTTPANGSFFAIGTTVVTTSTADGQSCSFTVTVSPPADTENPTIDCPDDITVPESSAASDSAVVTYTVTANDNSGGVTVNCDPPSGSTFPAGTTQVTCTATDASGNSASCSFNVTVTQSGCTLGANSAPPTPNASPLPTITRACSLTLLGADSPTATDACGSTIIGTTPDRTFDTPGTHTIVWTYTDSAGHSTTQNQTVVIEPDNSAPVPDAASLPTVTGECSAAITGDPPTATDNCGGSGIVGVPLDPLSYTTPGTHTVRWQFSDTAGNSTIQNQTVVVTDGAAPVPDVASLPTLTGECSVTVTPPTATDNCAGAIIAVTPDPVTYTAQGTYTVHWTYTDPAGNTTTQNQTVIVKDVTAPTLVAPDIVVSTDAASCSAVVDFVGLTASDNCGTPAIATDIASGSTFPKGTTVVTATATDVGGNVTTKTFNVTVNDTVAPVVGVPADIVVDLPLNAGGSAAVTYNVTFADNCGLQSQGVSPASGSVFYPGTTTVTATATDTSGNVTTKTFNVTVRFVFAGFFSPVSNTTLNQVNGGRSVPVKFSLQGNQGMGVLAQNSPYSQQVVCGSTEVTDLQETGTAGSSSLTYDASSGQYVYVWKTESSWAGTCRLLTVKLADGNTYTAAFKFK